MYTSILLKMHCFIIYITLVSQALGSQIKDEETSIIQEDLANIEDYPYYVTICYDEDVHICGGSIIHRSVILTAAHCVINITQMDRVTIYTGITTAEDIPYSNGYKVKEYSIHPSYNPSNIHKGSDHDLVLLKLDRDIGFGRRAEIIKLSAQDPKEEEQVAVVGFGKDRCDQFVPGKDLCVNPMSKYLRCAVLPVKKLWPSLIECDGKYQNICHGDSGGPMLYHGALVGVCSVVDRNCTSWNVYTRLSTTENMEWIKRQMQLYGEN